MSSNASRRLELWLVLAGMVAATAWYARPQATYLLVSLRQLLQLAVSSLTP